MPYHVSKDHFNELVKLALSDVPEQFSRVVDEVTFEVRDRSTPDLRKLVGMRRGHLLLGLYRGRPLTGRHVEDSGTLPDVIYLFQDDIEQLCDNEQQLGSQVRTTVLHEIGHYFGLSEEELRGLGFA